MVRKFYLRLILIILLIICLSGCGEAEKTLNPTESKSNTTPTMEVATPTPTIKSTDEMVTTTPNPSPEPTDEHKEIDFSEYVDFVVNVENGRDLRVLQLTDIQIIDSSQKRYPDRINAISTEKWSPERFEENYKGYVRKTIEEAKPDLIIITGDMVYGEFDDNGTAFLDFIAFMDSFGIPWAPVFGNHDNESAKGVDWQCQQLENAEHCLFKQRTLTGNGNYTVGIVQDSKLLRVFFMMDSNGCGAMSLANNHSKKTVGFGNDQVEWFKKEAERIRKASKETNFSFAFHIQLNYFKNAFSKYGFTNSGTANNPINIDMSDKKADKDFGYIGSDLKSPWDDGTVHKAIKDTGADSIFVGHEHCNSGSVVYEGIRYQFGQKSSTYDRCNYKVSKYNITGGTLLNGTPIIGGTLIILEKGTGVINDAYIVYASGDINVSKPSDVIGKYTYTYDFNGSDFDMTVTTDALRSLVTAKILTETVSGSTGKVAGGRSDYLVSVGVSFKKAVLRDAVVSLSIRMLVEELTPHSQNPLIRLYDNTNNTILVSADFSASGGIEGKWIEIELLSLIDSAGLVKDNIIQPFTFVYRCYGADAKVYFDSITLKTDQEL